MTLVAQYTVKRAPRRGGAPYRFHPDLYRDVGADAWGDTAAQAPGIVARLVREVRS